MSGNKKGFATLLGIAGLAAAAGFLLVSLAACSVIGGHVTYYPNRTISAEANLDIDVTGLDVRFDENSTQIRIPDVVTVRRAGDTLYLSVPGRLGNNTTIRMIVGTARPFERVDIGSAGLDVTGKVTSDYFGVNSVGTTLDDVEVNSDTVKIDGVGVKIAGTINARRADVSGVGVNLEVDLSGTGEFSIDGTGVNGSVRYNDTWDGTRNLSVAGSGKLTVYTRSSNSGFLNVDSSRSVTMDRRYF